jgi:hypothetical protein
VARPLRPLTRGWSGPLRGRVRAAEPAAPQGGLSDRSAGNVAGLVTPGSLAPGYGRKRSQCGVDRKTIRYAVRETSSVERFKSGAGQHAWAEALVVPAVTDEARAYQRLARRPAPHMARTAHGGRLEEAQPFCLRGAQRSPHQDRVLSWNQPEVDATGRRMRYDEHVARAGAPVGGRPGCETPRGRRHFGERAPPSIVGRTTKAVNLRKPHHRCPASLPRRRTATSFDPAVIAQSQDLPGPGPRLRRTRTSPVWRTWPEVRVGRTPRGDLGRSSGGHHGGPAATTDVIGC